MQFIKFIKKILLLLPIFLVMVGFNYFIDPANLFKDNKYYKNIGEVFLSGKNVANLSNVDERLIKKYYLDGLVEGKDIFVFGSSRVMLINADMFPEYSFFNNSVSSASIEDNMAIYWMHRKKGFIPKVVIVGLDPWLLNKFNGNKAFQSIINDYEEIQAYLGSGYNKSLFSNLYSSKYLELVSPKYFQSAVKLWLLDLSKEEKDLSNYYPTTDNVSDEIIRRADGSISYDIKYRSANLEEVRSLAVDFANDEASMLKNFIRLDPVLEEEFDSFVSLLEEDGVKIIFYLPPYHPAAYEILSNSPDYKIIKDVQNFFMEYAKNKNIELIGSYDPGDCSLAEVDFYDAMHQDIESVNKMFLKIKLENN